jgi:phytanoyl-CoA hydroxylase
MRQEGEASMDRTELPPELSEEQIAIFQARGFLLLGRFISDQDLERLRSIYDQVLERRLGHVHREAFDRDGPHGRYQMQVLQPEYSFPELLETKYFRYGRSIASRLLATAEPELKGYSHLIYKPPLCGRDTTWHQDEAYWLNAAFQDNEPRAVTIWLTLDEASLESGCMSFVPGSHDRGVTHDFEGDSASLVVRDPDLRQVEVCPMSPGEASVHGARMVHATGPNTTANERRAWSLEYHAPPVPRREVDNRPWLPELRRRMDERSPQGII